MRRIEPAYPDLFSVTHVLRPGYLPGKRVALDPIKSGGVGEDAPVRILPAEGSVPREPVRAMVFARVAAELREVIRDVDQGAEQDAEDEGRREPVDREVDQGEGEGRS